MFWLSKITWRVYQSLNCQVLFPVQKQILCIQCTANVKSIISHGKIHYLGCWQFLYNFWSVQKEKIKNLQKMADTLQKALKRMSMPPWCIGWHKGLWSRRSLVQTQYERPHLSAKAVHCQPIQWLFERTKTPAGSRAPLVLNYSRCVVLGSGPAS